MGAARRFSVLAAVIPAIAALLGAGVGGLFTYRASLSQADAETDRQEAREHDRARAAARLLIAEYDEARSFVSLLSQQRVLVPVDREAVVRLTRDERQALASELNAESWAEMNRANALLSLALRGVQGEAEAVGADEADCCAPLPSRLERTLALAESHLRRGDAALRDLAELGPYEPRP